MTNSSAASSTDRVFRIGTRGSDLALWQAHTIQGKLKDLGYETAIDIIKTRGDRIDDIPFSKLEGKDFFTKELEDAQLEGRVDLAVHSLKDLATDMPDGLVLTAMVGREDPREVLLVRPEAVDQARLDRRRRAAAEGRRQGRHQRREASGSAAPPAARPEYRRPARQRPDPGQPPARGQVRRHPAGDRGPPAAGASPGRPVHQIAGPERLRARARPGHAGHPVPRRDGTGPRTWPSWTAPTRAAPSPSSARSSRTSKAAASCPSA